MKKLKNIRASWIIEAFLPNPIKVRIWLWKRVQIFTWMWIVSSHELSDDFKFYRKLISTKNVRKFVWSVHFKHFKHFNNLNMNVGILLLLVCILHHQTLLTMLIFDDWDKWRKFQGIGSGCAPRSFRYSWPKRDLFMDLSKHPTMLKRVTLLSVSDFVS